MSAATATKGDLLLLGGCGGIGRALTALASERGYQVDVIDLPASIDTRRPPNARTMVAADARDDADLARAFAALAGTRYTGFVNLCGFNTEPSTLAATSRATWDEMIDGNLGAAFSASRLVTPLLSPGGAIVHVGSGIGTVPRPGYGPYAVVKAGLGMLCRQLALELAPAMRVNCVAPGAVDTDFLRGGLGRAARDDAFDRAGYAARVPLGRMATPDDVTRAIMFLLGEDAQFITGQTLHVNGGLIMP